MQSSIKTSLAGLVLVALCGGAFYLASQKRGESILPPPAGNTSVEETQVAPLVRINTTTSTPTSCDGLSAEDKESCIKNKESEQVSAARTISDCAGLTLSKDSCEDTFRLRTAEINRNIDNCNDIVTEGVKVQCREKVTYLIATFDGRPDLCQNISADPSLGVLCKERANKVAASTQKLETNAKILTEAVSSGDENKCKTL